MKCENKLCIYQDNNKCTNKNKIEIDWHGFCKNMVPVNITRNTLNPCKFITQLQSKDGYHSFNKETGTVILIGEPCDLYNEDFDI